MIKLNKLLQIRKMTAQLAAYLIIYTSKKKLQGHCDRYEEIKSS